jgi:acetyltransferase-like isoleucine patch superfamily enzyme
VRKVGRQLYEINYGWGPRLMSALRKRWILLTHRHANIVFGRGVHVGPGFSVYIPENGTLIVGDGVEFRRGFRAEVVGRARVVIGARCVFSYYSLIQCSTSVEIGEGCGFGQSCAIFDGNHLFKDLDKPFMHQGFELRPIRIGKECGVLTKTTVIHDIGDRSQIGANSVVSKPIPAYCVAVGAPARVVDYFGPEDQRPPEPAQAPGSQPARSAG